MLVTRALHAQQDNVCWYCYMLPCIWVESDDITFSQVFQLLTAIKPNIYYSNRGVPSITVFFHLKVSNFKIRYFINKLVVLEFLVFFPEGEKSIHEDETDQMCGHQALS